MQGFGFDRCTKCGLKDANRFAVANRCTRCSGEGVVDCFKCAGSVSACGSTGARDADAMFQDDLMVLIVSLSTLTSLVREVSSEGVSDCDLDIGARTFVSNYRTRYI